MINGAERLAVRVRVTEVPVTGDVTQAKSKAK